MPGTRVKCENSVGDTYVLNKSWPDLGIICYRRISGLAVFPSGRGKSSLHGGMEGVCRVVISHREGMGDIITDQVSTDVLRRACTVGLFLIQTTLACQGLVTN